VTPACCTLTEVSEKNCEPYPFNSLSVHALSQALRVPATRLHEIVKERRSITPDTALRLARYFGTDAQSWLNLQLSYDLKIAEAELRDRIEREVEEMAA
jgi:antitoxin HigA-1